MCAYINPATGIEIPNVGDPGTPYAQEVSDGLNKLANLTHTGPANQDGYQLTQAALDFTGDLPLNSNNLIAVRSTRMVNESSVLAGSSDTNCLYVTNGNLYFNNASGTPIELTAGAVPATPPTNLLVGQTILNTNLTILPTNINNLINVSTTTTAVTITLPVAATVLPWRFYYIVDIGGNAGTNNITINVAGGSGNTISVALGNVVSTTSAKLQSGMASCLVYTDGISKWYLLEYQKYQYNNEEVEFKNASTLVMDTGTTFTSNGLVQLKATTDFGNSSTIIGSPNFGNGIAASGLLLAANSYIAAQNVNNIQSVVTGGIVSNAAAGIQSVTAGGIQLAGGASDYVTFSSPRTLTFGQPIGGQFGSIDASFPWTYVPPYGIIGASAGNGNNQGMVPLLVHNGATLTAISVKACNSGSAGRTVPGTVANVSLMRQNIIAGSSEGNIVSIGNTNAPNSLYATNLFTDIIISGLSEVINTSLHSYFIQITDEYGTNEDPGATQFNSYTITYTISNMQFAL